jgi:hypothetical protein
MEGGISIELKKNKKLAGKWIVKKGRSRFFYLHLRSLLLSAVAKVALVLASTLWGWVCGPRNVVPVEGGILIELKKIKS